MTATAVQAAGQVLDLPTSNQQLRYYRGVGKGQEASVSCLWEWRCTQVTQGKGQERKAPGSCAHHSPLQNCCLNFSVKNSWYISESYSIKSFLLLKKILVIFPPPCQNCFQPICLRCYTAGSMIFYLPPKCFMEHNWKALSAKYYWI